MSFPHRPLQRHRPHRRGGHGPGLSGHRYEAEPPRWTEFPSPLPTSRTTRSHETDLFDIGNSAPANDGKDGATPEKQLQLPLTIQPVGACLDLKWPSENLDSDAAGQQQFYEEQRCCHEAAAVEGPDLSAVVIVATEMLVLAPEADYNFVVRNVE